jgi:hypothetical protein
LSARTQHSDALCRPLSPYLPSHRRESDHAFGSRRTVLGTL